jgi:hypothetical protein
LPSYPQGDLETPFLKEELFVGESEAGWEARVAALEAESPFQSALEQDQTTLIEPKEMEAEMLAEELVEEGEQAVSAHFPVEQADSYSEEAEQSADLVDGLNAEKFSEEEDELEEVLTDEEEEESRAVDEILSGLDRAVSLNRRYGEELGWRIQDDTIARFLGFIDYSPDEKTFAEAIARWQRSQSLKGDGILGPETWARLRAALPADNRERFPARSQPTSFIPTPVEAPGGGRIKDLTEPGQAELTTVEGFGGKPVELHRLTAEAWTALVQAARSDGFGAPLLLPISGYRGVKRQEVLWQDALRKYGSKEKARKWVAPPGGSAHQTGRAIDFYLGGKNSSENAANLRKLSVYRWLVANAARFGFYPYEREPWHWEYNPPAQRHEHELGESILLTESDEYPERLDEEEFDQETLEALAEYHGDEEGSSEEQAPILPTGNFSVSLINRTLNLDFSNPVSLINTGPPSWMPSLFRSRWSNDAFKTSFPGTRDSWINQNRPARARLRPREPITNVDGLQIPGWVDKEFVFDKLRAHYDSQQAELSAVERARGDSRAPQQILGGNPAAAVDANYFVVHDTANTRDRTNNDVVGSDVHLWIGLVSLARSRDWNAAGGEDATKLEGHNNNCFVHIELTRAVHPGPVGTAAADTDPRATISKDRAAGSRFTRQQLEDLANAYIVVSLRRGRFLTVTAHKELDRSATNWSLTERSHNDPEDFDVQHFYELINTKLMMPPGTTYGIEQARVNTNNQRGQVNEFIEYVRGNVAAADQYGPVRWQKQHPTAPQGDAPHGPGNQHLGLYRLPLHAATGTPANINCGNGNWAVGPP